MQIIPAVLYGHGVKNENLEIETLALQKIYRQAGSSTLVDLRVDDRTPVKVLIHDVQRDPLRQDITHVDFYQVKMTEKLQADIELEFVGESVAVKEQGGILVRALDRVKVECLPGDLIASLPVDISRLKTFEDRIHVADLAVPKGITVLDRGDEVVVSVTPPRSQAELDELTTAVAEDVSAVEQVEKKPTEEETPAEPAAPEAPTT